MIGLLLNKKGQDELPIYVQMDGSLFLELL